MDSYTAYFERNEAFFGSDAGWYAVEVTSCDTIIDSDRDSDGNQIPFSSKQDADAYRAHYHRAA